jgi:hypothetical protein
VSIAQYRSALRSAARGLWGGVFDYAWFADAMMVAIDQGMMRAFVEGTEACGIKKAEWTFEERMAQRRAMFEQYMHIGSLGEFIQQNTKATGGKWGAVANRVEVWVQRYNEVKERAQSMACADYPAIWNFGKTEKHCDDCAYAAGRVYRLSTWDRYGYIPGSSALACGGWRCDCSREQTKERVTPGRPRALRGA